MADAESPEEKDPPKQTDWLGRLRRNMPDEGEPVEPGATPEAEEEPAGGPPSATDETTEDAISPPPYVVSVVVDGRGLRLASRGTAGRFVTPAILPSRPDGGINPVPRKRIWVICWLAEEM